jgi:hypothetical protein
MAQFASRVCVAQPAADEVHVGRGPPLTRADVSRWRCMPPWPGSGARRKPAAISSTTSPGTRSHVSVTADRPERSTAALPLWLGSRTRQAVAVFTTNPFLMAFGAESTKQVTSFAMCPASEAPIAGKDARHWRRIRSRRLTQRSLSHLHRDLSRLGAAAPRQLTATLVHHSIVTVLRSLRILSHLCDSVAGERWPQCRREGIDRDGLCAIIATGRHRGASGARHRGRAHAERWRNAGRCAVGRSQNR